jgi:hypothetical protein
MDMIERVARAISQVETDDPELWETFIEPARAAIRAVREPTPACPESLTDP